MSIAFELRICLAWAALWWQNEIPLMCLTLWFQQLQWTGLVARRWSSFCFFSFYFLVIFLPSLKELDGYDGLDGSLWSRFVWHSGSSSCYGLSSLLAGGCCLFASFPSARSWFASHLWKKINASLKQKQKLEVMKDKKQPGWKLGFHRLLWTELVARRW